MITDAYPSSVSAGLRLIADSISQWGHFQDGTVDDAAKAGIFDSPKQPGKCCILYNPVMRGTLTPESLKEQIGSALREEWAKGPGLWSRTTALVEYNDATPTEEVIRGLHALADRLEEKH